MSILLIILKITGILLLVIFVLAALILFHPVFYRVRGEGQEEISAEGHFWWLFHLIRIGFQKEGGNMRIRIRIFGIPKEFGTQRPNVQEEESAFEEEAYCSESEPETAEKPDAKEPDLTVSGEPEYEFQERKPASKRKHKKKREAKDGFKSKFAQIKTELTDSGNHQAISHLWREFCYLISHLKPKRIEAEIVFSTGDPSMTGTVTGALSLFPVIYRYDAHIYPDFASEKFYIKGSLLAKGHVTMFRFFVSMIRLICDRNIKRLLYKFRK